MQHPPKGAEPVWHRSEVCGWHGAAQRAGTAWRVSLAVLAVLPVLGCGGGVLDPRGPVGAADHQIMINALEIMLVIVVPTIAAALFFAWRFREGNRTAPYRPHFVYSGRIELIVWSIPLLTIMFLGGVIWIGSHQLDPFRPLPGPKPLEVQVVSLDWKWLFIYPDQGIASINQLIVPAARPLHFSLTSASVMNGFFVPQLGSMVAVMNGMVTQLSLEADQPGDFFGESTQFSGDGFSGMHFLLRAVPDADFEQWISQAKRSGRALDAAAYAALTDQTKNAPPATYGQVSPDLFRAVATQQLPPGPGPAADSGGPAVRPQSEH